ncbi:MAG: hypothetical protein CBARDCOR_4071 [uncultured Caballeronia sp.]|nr:MAG: hypothetical protein CBARDCOR_4071 [uncultured Caballeronia sp.]
MVTVGTKESGLPKRGLTDRGASPRWFVGSGSWVHDGKFTCGNSEANAVRAHHIETGKWNGCWNGCFISTTRDYDIACRFATAGNTCNGMIYHIDETLLDHETLLDQYEILAKELPYPLYPDESEVSVRFGHCGPLPLEVIVRIDEVSPS